MTVMRVKSFVTVACFVAVAGSSVAGQDVVTLRDLLPFAPTRARAPVPGA